MQFEEYALRLNASDFASRSKAKAKPQRRESASSSTRTVHIGERTWTDVEPGEYSISDYEVSKKLIHLLHHGCLPRENDGAIEFWRIKDYLQTYFLYCHNWSDGNKKRFQCCTDSSGAILYLRGLQGHSGRSLIDPTLQDGCFQYIYHVGCATNLHSIINSGLIPGGQNLSNRQTVFFLPVDPMEKEHKDPETVDLGAPRRAQYMHKAWKKHQNTVYWVDINLSLKKGLKFYQTRSNAIILHKTLPAYCIPKVVRMETGEAIYEKVYMSPRPPPKISLKHEWKRESGSEHAQRAGVGQLSESFQSNQPTLNPIRERSGRPDSTQVRRKTSRSQEIDVNSFCEEPSSSERTGRLVETNAIQTRSSEDRMDFNVEPPPPPKISLKHDWMKKLGSEVAQQPDGEVVQQSKSSQSSQPESKPRS